jgi:hypothetical protein
MTTVFHCLPSGNIAKFDLEDFIALKKISFNEYTGKGRSKPYLRHYGDLGIGIGLHRIIIKARKGEYVDHKNCDTLDNRKSNLRLCNLQQNAMNQSVQNIKKTSIYKGVYYKKDRSKWRANIKINGKNIHIGYFLTQEEAAIKYNEKALEIFGEFARINNV